MSTSQPALAQKPQGEGLHKPLRICFVCSGNTCRSPMAEAVANHIEALRLQQLPPAIRPLIPPRWEAFSAGMYATEGEPIAPNAVRALEDAEILPAKFRDYHQHEAHCLTEEEAERYDLLIGMTRAHAMKLMIRYPHLTQKIIAMPQDISDPYGGTEKHYALCLEHIRNGVEQLLAGGDAP